MINDIRRLNLKRILKEKGVSQAELARRIGVKPPYISSLMSGSQNIGGNTLIKICRALNVSEEEFYEGIGGGHPKELLQERLTFFNNFSIDNLNHFN